MTRQEDNEAEFEDQRVVVGMRRGDSAPRTSFDRAPRPPGFVMALIGLVLLVVGGLVMPLCVGIMVGILASPVVGFLAGFGLFGLLLFIVGVFMGAS